MERLPQTLERAKQRLLQMDKLEALYRSARSGPSFPDEVLRELNIATEIAPEDLHHLKTADCF